MHTTLSSRFIRTLACLSLFALWLSAQANPPAITNVTLLPSRLLSFQLIVDVGQDYTFEISTNLVNWEAVAGIENAPSNLLTVTDDNPVDFFPRRFYRLREGRYQRFEFGFMHFTQAGAFVGNALTPTVSYPISFESYSPRFSAQGDSPYPDATQVFFTGPSGSGVTTLPASTNYSQIEEDGEAWYQPPGIPSTAGAPTGTWTVTYRGTNMTFNSSLQPLNRLVIPVPTVTVKDGILQSVSWTYHERTLGTTLGTPPDYMQSIQVQIEGTNGRLYNSPDEIPPTTTNHVFTKSVSWADVQNINLAYDDVDDHHYVIFFPLPSP